MARPINRLSARGVATAKKRYHADGGGLYLLVSKTGTRSWVLRYQFNGRRREMGLGSAAVVTLQEARADALQQRKVLASGRDPLQVRRVAQAAGVVTWGWCVDQFIESIRPTFKNDAQAGQWTQSLADHGPDRDLPIGAVDTAIVVRALSKLWTTKTETATRLRGRIERVWDWARVSGYVAGENPARWRGHLDKLLPKPSKVKRVVHHAAMPYADLPAFMPLLRDGNSLGRKALEFTLLTVARTAEVTESDWPEYDLDDATWTIPGERMKAGKLHTVPLVPRAVEILRSLPRGRPPFSLSENTMLKLLRKHMRQPYTVHGFRSSFSDWAHETTDFPNHVIEMALAHKIKSQAEAAYRRGALLEKRRELMRAWADYLASKAAESPVGASGMLTPQIQETETAWQRLASE